MPKAGAYPGLRDAIIKLVRDHPTSTYRVGELVNELKRPPHPFKNLASQIVSYHVKSIMAAQMFITPTWGKYQWNSDYKSPTEKAQQVAAHIANGNGVPVKVSDGFAMSMNGTATTVNVRYVDEMARSLSLIKQRMKSELPANKIFYPEDAAFLDNLLAEWRTALLTDTEKQVLEYRAARTNGNGTVKIAV